MFPAITYQHGQLELVVYASPGTEPPGTEVFFAESCGGSRLIGSKERPFGSSHQKVIDFNKCKPQFFFEKVLDLSGIHIMLVTKIVKVTMLKLGVELDELKPVDIKLELVFLPTNILDFNIIEVELKIGLDSTILGVVVNRESDEIWLLVIEPWVVLKITQASRGLIRPSKGHVF